VKFSIFNDLKEVDFKLNGDEPKEAIKLALSRAGQQGINLILDRTADGKDVKDKAFKPYSKKGWKDGYYGWRKRRSKSTRPNLFDKGHMVGSITSRSNSEQATIFFSTGAESRKAAFNQKIRPFFGFSRKDKKELAKFFARNLKV
jgi:phage gpG-like protein